MTRQEGELVGRAFGAANRARLLAEYFRDTPSVQPAAAWQYVYRLLLWTDKTTGLAHCYESDKAQPGRPWYARSLAFHAWLAAELGVAPDSVGNEIDWLFQHAVEDYERLAWDHDSPVVVAQRRPYEHLGMPVPGDDPQLAGLVCERMEPYLAAQPPKDVLRDLAVDIRAHVALENKRKNLVGEGFEDVLASLISRTPGAERWRVRTRPLLHELPGFYEPRHGEKPKRVDLALVSDPPQRRILVSAKWSIRADREEQFASDFDAYARLERAGQPFDYILVTNEFDPARLLRACDRQRENRRLFSRVIHVNPRGPGVVFGENPARSAAEASDRINSGRLESLEVFLQGVGGT